MGKIYPYENHNLVPFLNKDTRIAPNGFFFFCFTGAIYPRKLESILETTQSSCLKDS